MSVLPEQSDRLRFRNKFSIAGKIEQRRLLKYLSSYNCYRPPHPEPAYDLSTEQALENHNHLIDAIDSRLTCCQTLLSAFDIDVNPRAMDNAQVYALDSWAYQYWPAIYDKKMSDRINLSFDFQYSGKALAVRSLMFDVGLLIGQSFINKYPKAKWLLDVTEALPERSVTFNRTVVQTGKEKPGVQQFPGVIDPEGEVLYHFGAQKRSNEILMFDVKTQNVLGRVLL